MNPYKGEPMPFRNNWTDIMSNGPFNKIPVPKDVLVWNPFSQTWSNGDERKQHCINENNDETVIFKMA